MRNHETITLCNQNLNFAFGYNKKIFKNCLVIYSNDADKPYFLTLSLKGNGEWSVFNITQIDLWRQITSYDSSALELFMNVYHGLKSKMWEINKEEKTIRWKN